MHSRLIEMCICQEIAVITKGVTGSFEAQITDNK